MRIGCLFGTFDPPHRGHLAIAEHMMHHEGLDEVWLIVTPRNPFKLVKQLSAEQHRLEMVEMAVQGHTGLEVSDVEFGLPRPSFTADTLAWMRGQWPEHAFVLIIGSDNLAGLHRWKDPQSILANHPILVYPRPGLDEHLREAALRNHPGIRLVPDAPMLEISSTWIRQEVRMGRRITDWVGPTVEAYIVEQGLYGSGSGAA